MHTNFNEGRCFRAKTATINIFTEQKFSDSQSWNSYYQNWKNLVITENVWTSLTRAQLHLILIDRQTVPHWSQSMANWFEINGYQPFVNWIHRWTIDLNRLMVTIFFQNFGSNRRSPWTFISYKADLLFRTKVKKNFTDENCVCNHWTGFQLRDGFRVACSAAKISHFKNDALLFCN